MKCARCGYELVIGTWKNEPAFHPCGYCMERFFLEKIVAWANESSEPPCITRPATLHPSAGAQNPHITRPATQSQPCNSTAARRIDDRIIELAEYPVYFNGTEPENNESQRLAQAAPPDLSVETEGLDYPNTVPPTAPSSVYDSTGYFTDRPPESPDSF